MIFIYIVIATMVLALIPFAWLLKKQSDIIDQKHAQVESMSLSEVMDKYYPEKVAGSYAKLKEIAEIGSSDLKHALKFMCHEIKRRVIFDYFQISIDYSLDHLLKEERDLLYQAFLDAGFHIFEYQTSRIDDDGSGCGNCIRHYTAIGVRILKREDSVSTDKTIVNI